MQQRGVAAVVENEVGDAAVVPLQDAVGVVPVFFQRFALFGEDRRPLDRQGRGGVILRREDVAARPANLGAERLQGLDEDGRLDRHVQAAGDARSLERLAFRVFLADGHQAGHLVLGDGDFLAAPVGQCQVRDHEVLGSIGLGHFLGLGIFWQSPSCVHLLERTNRKSRARP